MLHRPALSIFFLILIAGYVSAAPTTGPALGDKIVAYCKDHLNQQVGDGECSSLAGHALRDANAKVRGKDNPSAGDYTWGELALVVESSDGGVKFSSGKATDLRPGDIIQFRDVRFEHHNGRRFSFQNYHHHTAVVASADGTVVHVFQQNVSGKRFVVTGSFDLTDLKEGWLRFYHPVAK